MAIKCPVGQSLALVLPRNDDRYASLLRYGGTDRTEHHPGESAAAVTTDDDELSLLSLFEKMADGPLKLDHTLDRDLRIAFLPAGKALGKRLVRRGLHGRGVNAE